MLEMKVLIYINTIVTITKNRFSELSETEI